jgi:diguanylate cyclase (GGDEF)-like protein
METSKLRGNKQYFLVIALLGLLFLAVTSLGMYVTVTSSNDVERQRTARLAELAVKAQLNSLKSASEENGYWDEAADNIYRSTEHGTFFERNWLASTADNDRYELIFIVDGNGKAVQAGENGALVALDPAARFGSGFKELMASLKSPTESGAILVPEAGGVAILAASNIRYTDPAMNAAHVSGTPHRILFKKHVDPALVKTMGADMGIPGLRLGNTHADRPTITLRDSVGGALGQLSWNPPNAGNIAAWRSLPTMAAGSLLFFVILSMVGRSGYFMIRGLSEQALTDSLSHMPNRRALRRAIIAQEDACQPFALALIDLDGFKNVNDCYGHAVGDRLIRHVSDILVQKVGGSGMVARLGGDEFAILLAGEAAGAEIHALSERFLNRLQYPIMIEERSISVGASIGVVATGEEPAGDGEMLRRADIAMYSAKRQGKMRIEWYDARLDEEQAEANELANELRFALSKNQIEVVYQPIVAVEGRHCETVEALARWTSPTRGPIAPDTFIPIAENTGLIDAIGLYVLRRACEDVRSWEGIKLAVNVSAAQLRNPMFPMELKKILSETDFEANRLELEITETYLIADTSLAQKVIEGVVALGVTISLDDFGTGYASIGFLRQFAFGKLKIDRSLVNEAQHDEAARMLVQVSVAAARALNMVVTAEGVETQAQADLMRVAGCDQLQGWHYGRPMECADLETLLSQAPERQHLAKKSSN